MIRDIAGRQNHTVKLARKLQQKKHRRERGLLVGEGMDLLRAALASGAQVRDVLVRRDVVPALPAELLEQARLAAADAPGPHIGICDAETLDYVSSLGGAADVIFSCTLPAGSLADVDLGAGLSFFLEGVGDPGNVGTIIRGMVAFGGQGVIRSPGTADPYGPKAMRAGMGAQFQVPVVVEVSPADLRARLGVLARRGGVVPEVWVADPHEGEDVRRMPKRRPRLVVLGAERSGPGGEWADAGRVTIRQVRFDSLNVAMAATVLGYELALPPDDPVANSETVR